MEPPGGPILISEAALQIKKHLTAKNAKVSKFFVKKAQNPACLRAYRLVVHQFWLRTKEFVRAVRSSAIKSRAGFSNPALLFFCVLCVLCGWLFFVVNRLDQLSDTSISTPSGSDI